MYLVYNITNIYQIHQICNEKELKKMQWGRSLLIRKDKTIILNLDYKYVCRTFAS
jgi:hypothetical protein